MISFEPSMLKAYFICGTQDLRPDQDLVETVQTALRAGITAYQFRDKGAGSTLTPETRLTVAKRLKDLCHLAYVPFIVDDDVDWRNAFTLMASMLASRMKVCSRSSLRWETRRSLAFHVQTRLRLRQQMPLRASPITAAVRSSQRDQRRMLTQSLG